MAGAWVKSLLVAVFSVFLIQFSLQLSAQENNGKNGSGKAKKEKKFDANKVIFGHVLDGHEFHFLDYVGKDHKEHHISIPLPVILYSPQKGWSVFMSSVFHHGEKIVSGYKLKGNKIVPVEAGVKVYDFSITRNVVQMFIALMIFVYLMLQVARRYKNEGHKAPTGFQNAMEVIITFIKDEVAKPNLGKNYEKYMPYLLTVFFFILINSIFGLIPGSANVSGNIAFTFVLGVISFIVILFSSNGHYWKHIFWPPVPGGVKPIMILVEIMSIFTKPFALIIRLFANMLAGHIIIICLVSLIFIFGELSKVVGWTFAPVSIAFVIFIYFIEILIAFLQAYIFANLTAVFVGQAFEESHADHDHPGVPDDAVII